MWGCLTLEQVLQSLEIPLEPGLPPTARKGEGRMTSNPDLALLIQEHLCGMGIGPELPSVHELATLKEHEKSLWVDCN